MGIALDWIEDNSTSASLVVTDSQSLCQAALGDDPDLNEIRQRFRNLQHPLTVQWVPGHAGIEGNELADAAAKEATELDEPPAAVTYNSVVAHIKKVTKDPAPQHERTKLVYSKYSRDREKEISNRSDQCLLAKLRSGHTTLLADYKARIENTHAAGG